MHDWVGVAAGGVGLAWVVLYLGVLQIQGGIDEPMATAVVAGAVGAASVACFVAAFIDRRTVRKVLFGAAAAVMFVFSYVGILTIGVLLVPAAIFAVMGFVRA